jgi:hypothetical protein
MRFAKVKLDNGREVFAGRLVDRNLEEQHIGTLETGTPAFRPVETAGDGPFDTELFSRMGPDYEVKPEKVIERFRLEPVPGAADILADRIAKKAGKARMQLTGTPSLGQHREFAWLTADAAKAIKLAEEEERLLGDEDRHPGRGAPGNGVGGQYPQGLRRDPPQPAGADQGRRYLASQRHDGGRGEEGRGSD